MSSTGVFDDLRAGALPIRSVVGWFVAVLMTGAVIAVGGEVARAETPSGAVAFTYDDSAERAAVPSLTHTKPAERGIHSAAHALPAEPWSSFATGPRVRFADEPTATNTADDFANWGRSVVLCQATGAGRTSDLLVDGIAYDVYMPTTDNLDRIVSAIVSKGSKVNGGGVVLDLSKSPITSVDPTSLLAYAA